MSKCDIQNINTILNLNFDNCYNNTLHINDLVSIIEKELYNNNKLKYILYEIETQLSTKYNYKVETQLKKIYNSINKLYNYLLNRRINIIYCDCDDYYDSYSDDNDYESNFNCYDKNQNNSNILIWKVKLCQT